MHDPADEPLNVVGPYIDLEQCGPLTAEEARILALALMRAATQVDLTVASDGALVTRPRPRPTRWVGRDRA